MPQPPQLAPYAFQKGNAGRPTGAETMYTKWKATVAKLKEMGFDWLEEAVNRFRDPETPHASKDHCLTLIAERVAPKLKAIEITTADGSRLDRVTINVVAGQATVPSPPPSAPPAIEHAATIPTPLVRDVEPVTEDDDEDDPDAAVAQR